MTTTTVTTEVRTIGACKHCKTVNVASASSKFVTVWVACRECGKQVQTLPVTGRYKENVKCGARCTSGRSGSCDCSCSGKNHGIDYTH